MLPKWITAPKVSRRAPRKRFSLFVEPLEERSLFATNVLAGGTLPPQFVTSLYTQTAAPPAPGRGNGELVAGTR